MNDDVQTVAQKAYDALAESFRSGQWEGFFGLFGPEVDVILPAPQSGEVFGEPYEAPHCIHIVVRDGIVVGFHEDNRPA